MAVFVATEVGVQVAIVVAVGAYVGVSVGGNIVYIADLSSLISLRLPDPTGIEEPRDRGEPLPDWYRLHQNYPNPFNPTTIIEYDLPYSSTTNLTVFNIKGQRVRTLIDERQSAGNHTVTWDGRDSHGDVVASGVYFYRLSVGNVLHSKKMLLLK